MSTITGVTPADVVTYTGVTVSSAQLAEAMSLVEVLAGIDLSDFMGFNAGDRKWLQAAVCYQAAWMLSQPDLFTRSDVQSMSQDGLSFTLPDEKALVLAPLAKRALGRVSWVRPHSFRIGKSHALRQYERGGMVNRYLPVGVPYTDADFDVALEQGMGVATADVTNVV